MDFKQKYFKYKNKYLKLRNQETNSNLEGGASQGSTTWDKDKDDNIADNISETVIIKRDNIAFQHNIIALVNEVANSYKYQEYGYENIERVLNLIASSPISFEYILFALEIAIKKINIWIINKNPKYKIYCKIIQLFNKKLSENGESPVVIYKKKPVIQTIDGKEVTIIENVEYDLETCE